MLLGSYTSVAVFQPAAFSVPGVPGNPREFNFKYFAPYVQDDWNVNSTLTVNLGLRWDYRSVPYETRNRMAWRNLDYAPGGMLVADASLVDGGIADGGYYQFADGRKSGEPRSLQGVRAQARLRVAPVEDGKTVVRGGYGMFYDSAEGREIDGAADVYPYVSRGNYHQSVGQAGAAADLRRAVPQLRDARPGDARGQHVPGRQPVAAAAQPYVQQWSLGVQREVSASTSSS